MNLITEKKYEEMDVKELFKIFSDDKTNAAVRNILTWQRYCQESI